MEGIDGCASLIEDGFCQVLYEGVISGWEGQFVLCKEGSCIVD